MGGKVDASLRCAEVIANLGSCLGAEERCVLNGSSRSEGLAYYTVTLCF